jgi:hypothetical protein
MRGLTVAELPDEWKFLNQLQDWEAPPELRTPPKGPTINLLLQIVSSDLVGNDVIQAAGRMLSSYAALNAWVSTEAAGELDFEVVSRVAAEISFATREVYVAWIAFRAVFEPVRRVGVGVDERSALLLAIRNGTTRLEQLRHAGQ